MSLISVCLVLLSLLLGAASFTIYTCRRGRGGATIADMRPLTGKVGCSPWHALPALPPAGAGAESPLAASRWTFVQPGCGCGLQSWAGPCTCRGQGVFTIRCLIFFYLTSDQKSTLTPNTFDSETPPQCQVPLVWIL